MTSVPTITCSVCGSRRNCLEHMRSEFPPDAARQYLRRRCSEPSKCQFEYRAGIERGLTRLDGQEPR